MSSVQIIDEFGVFPFVVFGGGYRCDVPSVVDAVKATEIEIEGIAGVSRHEHYVRIYPRGRFCCGECGEWKVLDVSSRAWAIRSTEGTCPLVCPKLVCEECSDSEAFSEDCRFAIFAHEDMYLILRDDAKKAWSRALVRKWRENARLRKERREFALNTALVFRKVFECRPEGWQQAWSAFMAHA
jgi:hypothetical protein